MPNDQSNGERRAVQRDWFVVGITVIGIVSGVLVAVGIPLLVWRPAPGKVEK